MRVTPGVFRKKIELVEAMPYDGTPDSAKVIVVWAMSSDMTQRGAFRIGDVLFVRTMTGDVRVLSGDWVIRDDQDRFSVLTATSFRAEYEPYDSEDPVPAR